MIQLGSEPALLGKVLWKKWVWGVFQREGMNFGRKGWRRMISWVNLKHQRVVYKLVTENRKAYVNKK